MTDGCVYFIAGRRAIKIGYTTDLPGRMQALNTASSEPLRLIGAIPGDRGLEARLHRELAEHRLHGEWFDGRAAIAALHEISGLDPLDWLGERTRLRREAASYRRRLREAEVELARVKGEL